MELKHEGAMDVLEDVKLLIVPYGIETFSRCESPASLTLLIVPYGIETHFATVCK